MMVRLLKDSLLYFNYKLTFINYKINPIDEIIFHHLKYKINKEFLFKYIHLIHDKLLLTSYLTTFDYNLDVDLIEKIIEINGIDFSYQNNYAL